MEVQCHPILNLEYVAFFGGGQSFSERSQLFNPVTFHSHVTCMLGTC